jgi:cell division protein FtsB
MSKKIRWIVILVSLFMIISLSRSVMDLWEKRAIVKQEQERLSVLSKKHEELTKKFEMVQTPAFIEKEARERLGMAKEGETVIIMGDSSLPQQQAEGKAFNDVSRQEPNWKRWWMIFF